MVEVSRTTGEHVYNEGGRRQVIHSSIDANRADLFFSYFNLLIHFSKLRWDWVPRAHNHRFNIIRVMEESQSGARRSVIRTVRRRPQSVCWVQGRGHAGVSRGLGRGSDT